MGFNSALRRVFFLLSAATLAAASVASSTRSATQQLAGQKAFVENKGQWDARALFLSRTSGLNFWVTNDGAVLDFQKLVPNPDSKSNRKGPAGGLVGHVVRIGFVNAQQSEVEGTGDEGTKFNYFLGEDKNRWASGARAFASATALQQYAGVSVRYSIDQGSPRYDLIIAPGADPSQVALRIEGANGLRVLPNGDLQIETSLGVVEERGLLAYQQTATGLTRVPCHTVLQGNILRFDIGGFDPSKKLVIDPLLYSTYLGGSTPGDTILGVATDSVNNAYVAGQAISTNFPTTTGAYQVKNLDANGTAFVSKLNASLSALTWSTYVGGDGLTGGSGGDLATGVAVDKTSTDVFITGSTASAKFPTTTGAFQTTNKEITNAGPDGFVTKFNSTGSALLYSTFLGGSGNLGLGDLPSAITIDSADDAYIVGGTYSTNFPVSASAFQKIDLEATNAGEAGFITKLNPSGTALIFSTYFAGQGDGNGNGDGVNCVTLDSSDNVYVGGFTSSSNFPTTTGAFQTANGAFVNGQETGFVAKLASTGSSLAFSTYLGGSTATSVNGIGLDSGLNVNVAGGTYSTDFPTTPTSFMIWDPETFSNSSQPSCGFVTRLASTGKSLVFSTYIGGSGGFDSVYAVKVDGANNVAIAGATGSSDFPTTAGAFQTVNNEPGSITTGFVAKVATTGSSLLYSTFLGGAGTGGFGESCNAVTLTSGGYALVAGSTNSLDFPVTAGGYDKQPATGFVSELSFVTGATAVSSLVLSPTSLQGGATATGTITLNNSTTADQTFKLTGSGPAMLPGAFVVPMGSATGSFQFRTEGVNTNTTVSITATSGTLMGTATATVGPPTLPTGALVLNQTDVIGGAPIGVTLFLQGLAGSPYTSVSLSSSNTVAVPVPASILVPYNSGMTRTTLTTKPVSAQTTVTITATLLATKVSVSLVVRPAHIALLTVPSSAVGGATVVGKVLLSGPAGPTNDVVSLASASSDAQVPVTVSVPAGSTSVTFNIVTKAVTANVAVKITASFAGSSQSQTITVEK